MDMDRGGSDIGKSQRNILFDGGFFKIVEQIDQRRIRSICLSCQRIGKEHTLLSLLGTTSNLITHLNVSTIFFFLNRNKIDFFFVDV